MLRLFRIIAWLVVVLVCPEMARAQDEAPVYTVPSDGTPLIIEGRLEEGDALQEDGTFFDTYSIRAPPGTLMVQLNSAAFDPYMVLFQLHEEQQLLIRLGENHAGPEDEHFGQNCFAELLIHQEALIEVEVKSTSTTSGIYFLAIGSRPNEARTNLTQEATKLLEHGSLLYHSSDQTNAEQCFLSANRTLQLLYPGDHAARASVLISIAAIRQATGRFAAAEPMYHEALAMLRRLVQVDGVGDNHDIQNALYNLAIVKEVLGNTTAAEPLLEESVGMTRRSLNFDDPQSHAVLATSISKLASVRERLGRDADAEPLYIEALEMYRRLYSATGDHPDIVLALNDLGRVRLALGDAADAGTLCEDALAMSRRLFQRDDISDHVYIATCLSNLAVVRQALGRVGDAEPLYEEALAIRRRLFQADTRGDNWDLVTSLNSLAWVRQSLGRSAEAEPLYLEALGMRRRLFQTDGIGDHSEIATNLNDLAFVRDKLGRFAEAESLYDEALAMNRRLFQTDGVGDHPNIATSLSNLASARGHLGRIVEAELLHKEALAMRRRLFQSEGVGNHPDIAISLNNLAGIYKDLGRAAQAEMLYEEALAMNECLYQVEGVGDHTQIAISLNNLASVRQKLGRAAEAEPLLQASLAMSRRILEADGVGDHPLIATMLSNLASVLQELGRAAEAEPLYQQALEMNRRLFQTHGVGDHPDVAAVLNNLASVRQDLGRAAEAEPLYQQALEMHKRLFPGDHPDVLVSLQNLALLVDLAEPQRAESLYTEALSMADRLRLATRGDAESRALMAEQVGLPQTAHWLGRVRLTLGQPEAAFAALETGRARSLMDLFELQYQGGLDAVIAKLPDEQRLRVESARGLEEARRAETVQAEAILAASANRTDLTDEDREQLRQDAIRARTALGDAVAATNTALGRAIPATRAQDPAELRAALLPGELVVAFGWDGNDAYLLTLDSRGADGAILFDGTDNREELVASLRTDLETFAGSLRTPGVEHDPAVALSLAHALIPERLRAQVSNADRLIVVTTGPLGRVPMNLILSALNERAGIVQAHSALQYIERRDEALRRTMARRRARTIEADAAVVLGRPQYAGSAPELPTYELAHASAADYISRSRSASRSLDAYRLMEANLTDLPGTQTEAMVISASLDTAGLAEGERRVTLLGPDASIPRLRAEVERLRPRVLHIATHGLIGSAEDPLDAALALTPGPDDYGFLTLDDLIRQWPGLLDDTDLVVLSACDTGWGATKGDAEFGLPWGFFLSGATSVVASLWQVDDASTALLMARFHEGRLGSFDQPRTIRGRTFQPKTRMTTLDALDEAKHWLRTLTHTQAAEALSHHAANLPKDLRGSPVQHNPNAPTASDHPYEHPYYWAPFVLLGSSE